MTKVTLPEAQQRLPELLAAAAAGEVVVITQHAGGEFRLVPVLPPVARSVRPRPPVTGVPRAGTCKGLFVVPDDFDEPLEELREYMG
jgi:prevent-host-death family protein